MDLLRGLERSPAVVGMARGLAEAVVFGGIAGAVAYFSSADLGAWNAAIPAVIFVVRSLEGAADHIDPAKQRAS